MPAPFISICIPAYKRIKYLQRLLESIRIQTYRDFEVVLSDDSPNDEVRQLADGYRQHFPIVYYHNSPSLGTPANWNFGISKATGEWIKLVHDDDWFASPNSLQAFADATKQGKKFIITAYTNHFEDTGKHELWRMPAAWHKRIVQEPLTLMASNVAGPPSVTMLHRNIVFTYDERMKWRVDIDFYIRVLQQEKAFTYIDEPLINVGMNGTQVTNSCFNNPLVEIPEAYMLLEKYGQQPLKNIVVYDAWWRMFRNMSITTETQLNQYGNYTWPPVILAMLQSLHKVPKGLIKKGPFSKSFMVLSFIKGRKLIQS